jgi:hypothetical protein
MKKYGWTPDKAAAEFEKFANHHRAHGKKMDDWRAAWYYWCSNVKGFAPRGDLFDMSNEPEHWPGQHNGRPAPGLIGGDW